MNTIEFLFVLVALSSFVTLLVNTENNLGYKVKFTVSDFENITNLMQCAAATNQYATNSGGKLIENLKCTNIETSQILISQIQYQNSKLTVQTVSHYG